MIDKRPLIYWYDKNNNDEVYAIYNFFSQIREKNIIYYIKSKYKNKTNEKKEA